MAGVPHLQVVTQAREAAVVLVVIPERRQLPPPLELRKQSLLAQPELAEQRVERVVQVATQVLVRCASVKVGPPAPALLEVAQVPRRVVLVVWLALATSLA